jgi:crotonobetainyl-CoA:carnitine CoA-transferase CaiB-like acyl-CoA transferase
VVSVPPRGASGPDLDWSTIGRGNIALADLLQGDTAGHQLIQATAGRLARTAELDGRVAAWTQEQDARKLTQLLQSVGVAVGS